MSKHRSRMTLPPAPIASPPKAPHTTISARHLLSAGIVAGVTFAAFLPALSAHFVNWDDERTILENPVIRELSWDNVAWMFTHHFMGHYQPLALVTLAVDYRLWGLEAFGYHLTNVVLHVLNGVLVYFLAVKLLELARGQSAGGPTSDQTSRRQDWAVAVGAVTAALLFAIHPLRVESVAWVTERRDVLSALFYLGATLTYLKSREPNKLAGRSRPWLAVAVVLVVCSLLAKVMAATAVVIFILLDWYPLGRIGGAHGYFGAATRRVWQEKIPFVVPALVLGLAAIWAQSAESAWRGLGVPGALKPFLGGLYGLAFYLWKTVWPTGLSPYYEMPAHAGDIDLRFVVAGVAILALGVPLLIKRHRYPALLAAWVCYLVLVFPVLGIFQNWPQIAADRYTYLPTLGVVILAGALVCRLAQRAIGNPQRALLLAPVAVIVLVLSISTWRQTKVWWNSFMLWERVLAIEPNNYNAHLDYGAACLTADQPAAALEHSRRAAQLRPNEASARTNVGLALIQMKRYQEAVEPLQAAIQRDPKYGKAQSALGVALVNTGDLEKGMKYLQSAAELEPNDPGTRAIYGSHLRHQGRLEPAIEQLEAAVDIEPANAQFRHELATTLQEARRYTRAVIVLREGLDASGRDPNLLDTLARLQATCPDPDCRDPVAAVRWAREACERSGHRVASMLETLALAYEANGKPIEATKALESAITVAHQTGEEKTAARCREKLAQLQTRPS